MARKELTNPADVAWQDVELGAVVTTPGSASVRRTGDWRTEQPVLDKEKCIKCGFCWLHCPDAAITPLDDGYFEPDLYHCKGCGICAVICPKKAITMVEEVEQ